VKPSDLKAGIASLEWGLVVGDLLIKAQALLAELLEDVDLNDEELDEQQVAYKEISRTISFQAMHYHAIMADQHEELARLHIEMAEKL
jgi:hypothetical protein